jgi:hypothetical protein
MGSLLGGTGPWAGANMACQLASATLAQIKSRFGGIIPPFLDVIVTVNKADLSLGGATPIALYQVDAGATGKAGTQIAYQSVAYGTTLRIPNVAIDPSAGGLLLTGPSSTLNAIFGCSTDGATLDFALPGVVATSMGGVNTKSLLDKGSDAADDAVREHLGDAAQTAIGGFVLIVIVIVVIIAFQIHASRRIRGG